jgi:hypothetical protein
MLISQTVGPPAFGGHLVRAEQLQTITSKEAPLNSLTLALANPGADAASAEWL